jgi:hypothetical protein
MRTSFYSSLPNRHILGCAGIRARRNIVILVAWSVLSMTVAYILWRWMLSPFLVDFPLPSRAVLFFVGFGAGFAACGYFYDQMIREFHRSLNRGTDEP